MTFFCPLLYSFSVGMDAWSDLYVPQEVLWALRDQGFTQPTPIQTQVLPSAIRDQMDVVGAAETVGFLIFCVCLTIVVY